MNQPPLSSTKLLHLLERESANREATALSNQSSGLRIALYSHDTMGLGHKRRTLLMAQTLAQAIPNSSILLITGMVEASLADLPVGIDYLALPALKKQSDGQYGARRLGLALADLVLLRAKTIRAALDAFNPDVLIVDNVPRGAMRELDLTLDFLRRRRQTLCVLGLRDVLDAPQVVRQQWQQADNEAALRQYYDAIWVYGDPKVYDLAEEYSLPPDIAAKIRYTGYLDACQRLQHAPAQPSPQLAQGPLALCLVGGGQDGAALAIAFAQSTLPAGWQGLIVTGPFMPSESRQQLQALAAQRPQLQIAEFVAEPARLLQQADAVVAMGGYNTTCELLSFNVRSLVVPRIQPRQEQLIRAQRLSQWGAVDMLHPHDLSPARLSAWLSAPDPARPAIREFLDLSGLDRLPALLAELILPAVRDQAS